MPEEMYQLIFAYFKNVDFEPLPHSDYHPLALQEVFDTDEEESEADDSDDEL